MSVRVITSIRQKVRKKWAKVIEIEWINALTLTLLSIAIC